MRGLVARGARAGPAIALAGLSLLPVRSAAANPHGQPTARSLLVRPAADPSPDPGLPMLPSVGRVRIEAARDRIVIVEDIDLPQGDWRYGDLDLYAAFAAPGPPIAVDAHLVAATPEERSARSFGPDDRVATRVVARRGAGVSLLLGKPEMAGVVLHVGDRQLRRTYASAEHAVLRIRSLVRSPAPDSTGARDVVVRLGIAGGLPMTLGRIQIVSREPEAAIARATATLCGPEADPWPLSVLPAHRLTGPSSAQIPPLTVAPSAAVRHASDDLCIRWWTAPLAGETGHRDLRSDPKTPCPRLAAENGGPANLSLVLKR